MNRGSWTAGLIGFAFAVLAVCWALQWAAALLLQALPVLLPAAGVCLLALFGWRAMRNRSGW